MQISTTRFGSITIDESRVIQMKGGGILGFEHLKRYVLLTQNEKIPFMWFQSIDDSSIAFVVINSFIIAPEYDLMIGDNDTRFLGIESHEDVVLMSIVTIRPNPFTVTANLRAPLVINRKNRFGKQIVLNEPDYPIQYLLTVGSVSTEASLLENKEKHSNIKNLSTALNF
ncbi:MAG: flagellar assembly protein FliW [Deltaproteobacteria bacterium]|nr:flagellar assembly protein FliW [Deltaproteobacteria bacterium]